MTETRIYGCAYHAKIPQTIIMFHHRFFYDIMKGRLFDVKKFIDECGIDPECENNRAIVEAVWNGHVEILKLLFTHHKEKKDLASKNLITLAIQRNHPRVLKFLLEEGSINPDRCVNSKSTPLEHAASFGKLEMVKLLLADPRVHKNNSLAISYAAFHNHLEVLKLLLQEESLNPDERMNAFGPTPLESAATRGDLETAKLLLANPRVYKTNSTAINCAARGNHLELVRFFLEEGSLNPDNRVNLKMTPLEYSASNGNLEMLELLLNDIRVKPEKENNLAIDQAALSNHPETLIRLLKDGRSPLNLHKNNLLYLTITKDYVEVIRAFLDNDPTSGVVIQSGASALTIAAQHGKLEIAKMILEKHPLQSPLPINNLNNKALEHSAQKGHLEIVT